MGIGATAAVVAAATSQVPSFLEASNLALQIAQSAAVAATQAAAGTVAATTLTAANASDAACQAALALANAAAVAATAFYNGANLSTGGKGTAGMVAADQAAATLYVTDNG